MEDKRYPLKITYPIIVKESDWTDDGEPIEWRLSDSNDIYICGQMKKNQADYVCELFNRCKPDQQPNDVEAVKPVINSGNHADKLYSQHTIDQLQEKIEDTEAKLKVAEEALERISKVGCNCRPEIAQSALDTIRKEKNDADKS